MDLRQNGFSILSFNTSWHNDMELLHLASTTRVHLHEMLGIENTLTLLLKPLNFLQKAHVMAPFKYKFYFIQCLVQGYGTRAAPQAPEPLPTSLPLFQVRACG